MITVPIVASIFFGVRTTGATETRVGLSDNMNVLSAYFVPDVQQALSADVNASDAAACGGPVTTVQLVLTTGHDPETSVSYFVGVGANANFLYRRTCSGGAPISTSRISNSLHGAPDFHPDTPGPTFTSVTATLTQADPVGAGGLYTSRVEAVRRSSAT